MKKSPNSIRRPSIHAMVEEVLHDIKFGKKTRPPVTSLTDIIPITELDSFFPSKRDEYINRFGKEKVSQYEKHLHLTNQIRAQFYAKKLDIHFAPTTTKHIATTLCGFGECGETCQRAALDLVLKFNSIKLNIPITILYTEGNRKASSKRYYSHGFIIIGEVPDFILSGLSLFDLKHVDDDCILLDPSLGIIGKANQTEILLKDIFHTYGINRLSATETFLPAEHAEGAKRIFQAAEKLSQIMKTQLCLPHIKPAIEPLSPSASTPMLIPGTIRLFDVNRSSLKLLDLTDTAANSFGTKNGY